MKQYYKLYVGKSLQQKKEQVLEKIKDCTVQLNVYLIVLTKNGKNQLEIYDSIMHKQEYFRKKAVLLIGIAEGYQEALELMQEIADEVYLNKQDADIRGYLLEEQQEYEEGMVR